MNQWSAYKMLIISQTYREITSCKIASRIHATQVQIKRIDIQSMLVNYQLINN